MSSVFSPEAALTLGRCMACGGLVPYYSVGKTLYCSDRCTGLGPGDLSGDIACGLGKAVLTPRGPADPVLSTDSEERKNTPIFSGVLNYFPLAIAAIARLSKRGNDKHNPGQPLHWSRDKSTDHPDCIARHLIDYETLNPKSGEYEDAVEMVWRGLALLETLEEKRLGKPISRGSR